ncbi:MAG: lipoate--protein ligase family protein [Acetobacteraceae bacterium]|nr:lipoate--protein ligase family protein [Acetobacteraceae bacterium]
MSGVQWRLILSGPADGPTNMAVDEALLGSCGGGQSPPTLRFYTWSPATASVGRFQDLQEEVDLEACRAMGIGWVRRPTGGRMVLHDRELTYSLAAPRALFPAGVVDSYLAISRGLVEGLRLLGVDARAASPPQGRASLAGACFDTPSWYEVTVGQRKVVGSAQVRSGGGLLQHGSVLLEFDASRLVRVLAPGRRGPDPEALAEFLGRRATGLWQAAGRRLSPSEVAQALAEGFARALGVRLVEGGLSPAEAERAERLKRQKYLSPEWNLRPAPRPARGEG